MKHKQNSAKLTVHPGIFDVLGRRLVSDAVRALAELIKNSYDADATEVRIRFVEQNGSRQIIVQDDGQGMTRSSIMSGWLQVGTPNKRQQAISRNGRAMTGSMGIGRLAAFSLADRIAINTGAAPSTWLTFSLDATKIAQAKQIDEIRIPIRRTGRPQDRQTGTDIILSHPRWWPDSDEEIQSLKTRLAAIKGPAGETFKIFIEHGESAEELEPEEALTKGAPYVIAATVDADGIPSYSVSATSSLYRGPAKIRRGGWNRRDTSRSFRHLANIRLTATWRPRGRRADNDYWQTSEIFASTPGIRVYRDDIRVMPYGEESNDWLNIEARYVGRGALSRMPRRNQVSGWVTISRKSNPRLMDTTNRDGLIRNEAFDQLVEFCQLALDFLAEVRRGLEPRSKAKRKGTSEVRKGLVAVDELRKQLPSTEATSQQLNLLEDILQSAANDMELLALYRDRLTAGNLLRLIIHDAGASLRGVIPLINRALAAKCSVGSHHKTLEISRDLCGRVLGGYDLMRGSARAGAYRLKRTSVHTVVDTLVERFRTASSLQADIIAEVEPVTARIREADLWSIVINLLHNALSCGEFLHGSERTFPQRRRVLLKVCAAGDSLTIACDDNGPGLPNQEPEWVWQQFNSTRRNGGSGLGLWIVADAARAYEGTYSASTSREHRTGARFEVVLPGVVPHED